MEAYDDAATDDQTLAQITQEMVDHAEEQVLKEEAEYYGKFMRR